MKSGRPARDVDSFKALQVLSCDRSSERVLRGSLLAAVELACQRAITDYKEHMRAPLAHFSCGIGG